MLEELANEVFKVPIIWSCNTKIFKLKAVQINAAIDGHNVKTRKTHAQVSPMDLLEEFHYGTKYCKQRLKSSLLLSRWT